MAPNIKFTVRFVTVLCDFANYLCDWGYQKNLSKDFTHLVFGMIDSKTKLILLITTFWDSTEWNLEMGASIFKHCPISNCHITKDKSLPISEFDALLFHLANIGQLMPEELPDKLIRTANQRYVMFFLEPPSVHWMERLILKLGINHSFNWTMTYRLDSDIPIPYGWIVPKLGEGGDQPNSDERKGDCMNLVLTRGREGVQNPENLADIIYALPLAILRHWVLRWLTTIAFIARMHFCRLVYLFSNRMYGVQLMQHFNSLSLSLRLILGCTRTHTEATGCFAIVGKN